MTIKIDTSGSAEARRMPGDMHHDTPLVRPLRLGHATFDTPDLDRAIDYYTMVNGLFLVSREKGQAFLASGIGQLAIILNQAAHPRCTKISFEVAPDTDFSALSRQLSEHGISSEQRSEPIPSIPGVLAFDDLKGTSIELFSKWDYIGKHHNLPGAGVLRFGHIAFCVRDPLEAAKFYCRIMGFRISDWIEDMAVFLRCGSDHHTINFFASKDVRMHHLAFELIDMAHMKQTCDLFAHRDIAINWGPLRQGPGHNIATYHRNHDDQVVEHYFELDQIKNEELGYFEPRPWHRDTPQRPRIWDRTAAAIWGPPPTADFIRNRG